MFEEEKKQIDFHLDTLAMKAFDSGWNAVIDSIHSFKRILVLVDQQKNSNLADVLDELIIYLGEDHGSKSDK